MFEGRGVSPLPAPPVLSYADERDLLGELEQAATGQLDFRTPRKETNRTAQQQYDRNLLPYVSVFEARHSQKQDLASSSSPMVLTPGSALLAQHAAQASAITASPSRPQLMSRRDQMEAESVLGIQYVEVTYAQMMTRLGLDSLQGTAMEDCLHTSLVEMEAFCLKQSFQLQGLCQKMMHSSLKYVSYKNAAAEMRQEAATWCLLRHLFFEKPVFDTHSQGITTCVLSQMVTQAVLSDAKLTDLANVVSWLEFLAGLDQDESPSKVPRVGSGDGVWLETKTQAGIGNGGVVTEMDPDAPIREGKGLSKENTKDNEKLLQVVWSFLRSGRLRDACNICRECGQPWRAASLAAGSGAGPTAVGEAAASQTLDPMFSEKECEAASDEYDVDPGLRRFLWKLSCHAISESASPSASPDAAVGGDKPLYEAATYGMLCGDVRRAVPACASWEDVLWAHCRSLLERKVDDTIGETIPPNQSWIAWQEKRPENTPKSLAEIFGTIENVDFAHVAQEKRQMQRQIQAFLILKDYPSLLAGLRKWILHPSDHVTGEFSFAEPPASPSMMRFAAHLVLFLRFLGIVDYSNEDNEFSEDQDLVNKILQVYIIHLMDTEQHDLVPVYAAHLRETSLDLTYMIFLDEMMKYSLVEQQKCYTLACKYLGESVPRLACKYATKVMQEACGPIEDNAEHRANAALWLCYEESMYHSALQHSIALCRDFSLGGLNCYEAASTLLLQVLSNEFWKWLESLKFEASHADVNRMDIFENDTKDFVAAAQELEDWRDWYEFQDAIRKWNSLLQVMRTGGAERSATSSSNARSTQSTGERLLDQAMALLTRDWLQTPDNGNPTAASNSALFLTCQLVGKPAGQEGMGFSGDASTGPLNMDTLESALNNSLKAVGGSHVASVKCHTEAEKIEISVSKTSGDTTAVGVQEDEESLAHVIGWAIKGNLSKDLQDVGLFVQHVDCSSNQRMCRSICKQVCLSKLMLQCIYIRQVLSGLPGTQSVKGQNLVQTIVGSGDQGKLDLAKYLTPFQFQELVLMEREATINELEKQGSK